MLHRLDWVAIAAYVMVSDASAVAVAAAAGPARRGGFALASRRLPWWIIGIADVATGDGADAFWIYVFSSSAALSASTALLGVGDPGPAAGDLLGSLLSPAAAAEQGRFSPSAIARRLRLPGDLDGVQGRGGSRGAHRLCAARFAQTPMLGWSQVRLLAVFGGWRWLSLGCCRGFWRSYMDLPWFARWSRRRGCCWRAAPIRHRRLDVVLSQAMSARGTSFLTWLPLSPSTAAARFGSFALDPWSLAALALVGL